MVTVSGVIERLEAGTPLSKAAGWDPVGLQLGDPDAPADRVAVCHEVTEDVMEAVAAEPVDLLVTYHPLLFRPTTAFVAGPSAAGRAYRLARAGTAVFVVHTAFDTAPGGAADALAEALGLRDTAGLGPTWGEDAVKVVTFAPPENAPAIVEAMVGAGAGSIGGYRACSFRSEGTGSFLAGQATHPVRGTPGATHSEPETRIEMIAPAARRDAVAAALVAAHPYEEPAYDTYAVMSNAGFVGRRGRVEPVTLGDLAASSAAALDADGCRVAGPRRAVVEQVAVVPGSGASFISHAAASADVLVTGDVSHHQAQEALARGLAVVDVGHVAGERPGVRRLYAAVLDVAPGARSLLDLDPSPWKDPGPSKEA
jgi:dinuclear metal center YbgI/SA1388 family protein